MGKFWLHDLLQPLSKEFGDKLKLYPGYEFRSRSTGGFESILGIVNHHDADRIGGLDKWATDYMAVGASSRPIGNFHVHRNGDIWFFAAGASNHAGKGGPVFCSKGRVPIDAGNKHLIGIEASNNGVGEPWPDVELDSYLRLDTLLCKFFDFDPLRDIFGHFDWARPTGRKSDASGPTPKYPKLGGLSGNWTWSLEQVRKEINARVHIAPPPSTKPDYSVLGRTYPTTPPSLGYGNIHPNVPWLQAILSSMGTVETPSRPIYNPDWVGADMVNGVHVNQGFGDATINALVYWQSWNNLTSNGVYDTVTANRMYQVRGK